MAVVQRYYEPAGDWLDLDLTEYILPYQLQTALNLGHEATSSMRVMAKLT